MAGKLELKKLLSQGRLCEEALACVLEAAFSRGAPADKTLGSLLRANRSLGSRDRNLISKSVFAVLRWWGWLGRLAGEEAAKLSQKASARLLLAASAAEEPLAPDVAEAWAIDAACESAAARELFSGGSPALRAAKALALFELPQERPLEERELVPSWSLEELSPAARKADLFAWLQKRPPIWIRAQTKDCAGLRAALRSYGLEAASHPFLESAMKIQGVKVNLHTLKEFNQGLFEIQDLSSQCIGLACAPKPGEMWWDACAGGGGKSLQLADLMNRKGSVRATDTRAYKLEDLKKRAARAAFPNIRTAPWDGTAPDPKRRAAFDGVLVDSPCSSSGRWRRNPDARWIASKAWVDELSEIQMKILSAASAAVKPGGVLVYATCSMFQREDADNAARFLSKHPEFSLEPFPNPLNGELTDGSLLTLPWDGDCDASFVARFRKGS